MKGNIRLNGTAIAGVHITVGVESFAGETCSDVDGKWTMYVPQPAHYVVTLTGSTLPTGMTIDGTIGGSDISQITITDGNVHRDVVWGLTDDTAVNFFFEK